MSTNSQQHHNQVATLQLHNMGRNTTDDKAHHNNPISSICADFQVSHQFKVVFANQVFSPDNAILRDLLSHGHIGQRTVFVYIDSGVAQTNNQLSAQITHYFNIHHQSLRLITEPQIIAGGEAAKQPKIIDAIYQQLLTHKVDRHSCVLVIGGGAVLDSVGYACATFHRGINLLRMPSTVLAQNDAGIGVKNGFNLHNTKNLIGTFAPPMAVLNDASLLQTLSIRDRRAGLAEAVKVAAIRDSAFFNWLETNTDAINRHDEQACQYAIARCAQLHINQITGAGDPFETGSARPLDYGHWSAHKLEGMANYALRHGEAVAIGMALDARYAQNIGLLDEAQAKRMVQLLLNLGFELWHPALDIQDALGEPLILHGLEEFRQHLGGQLCITMLTTMGIGKEVNTIEHQAMLDALVWLKTQATAPLIKNAS